MKYHSDLDYRLEFFYLFQDFENFESEFTGPALIDDNRTYLEKFLSFSKLKISNHFFFPPQRAQNLEHPHQFERQIQCLEIGSVRRVIGNCHLSVLKHLTLQLMQIVKLFEEIEEGRIALVGGDFNIGTCGKISKLKEKFPNVGLAFPENETSAVTNNIYDGFIFDARLFELAEVKVVNLAKLGLQISNQYHTVSDHFPVIGRFQLKPTDE